MYVGLLTIIVSATSIPPYEMNYLNKSSPYSNMGLLAASAIFLHTLLFRGEHSLLSGPFWYRNISDFLALVGNLRISVVLLEFFLMIYGLFGSTFGIFGRFTVFLVVLFGILSLGYPGKPKKAHLGRSYFLWCQWRIFTPGAQWSSLHRCAPGCVE